MIRWRFRPSRPVTSASREAMARVLSRGQWGPCPAAARRALRSREGLQGRRHCVIPKGGTARGSRTRRGPRHRSARFRPDCSRRGRDTAVPAPSPASTGRGVRGSGTAPVSEATPPRRLPPQCSPSTGATTAISFRSVHQEGWFRITTSSGLRTSREKDSGFRSESKLTWQMPETVRLPGFRS